MERVFLVVLGMSVTATVVILAVLLLRLCLRRAPKKISYILWLAVAFRLCCPVSVPFALSLFRLPVLETAAEPGRIAEVLSVSDAAMQEPEVPELPIQSPEVSDESPEAAGSADAPISSPSAEPSPAANVQIAEPDNPISSADEPQSFPAGTTGTEQQSTPAVTERPPMPEVAADPVSPTPIPSVTEEPEVLSPAEPSTAPEVIAEPVLTEPAEPDHATGTAKSPAWLRVLTVVWIAGASLFLLYGIAGALVLRRMLASAVWLEDNVWQSDRMRSPFLFGLIRPRIYVPFGLEEACLSYVLDHERYHIRHRDDLVKAAAFGILAVHWFNPFVWLAFHLMSRDMEMRCDEAVLSGRRGIAKVYSMSLLSFASDRRFPVPVTPAFGEGDVETRIRHILSWKKPKLWVSVLAGILAAAAVISCATNPLKTDAAVQPEEETENEEGSPDSASSAARSLAPLPNGDWQPLTPDRQDVLLSSGKYMDSPLPGDKSSHLYNSGWWNGWIRDGDAFRTLSIALSPYAETSFRWVVSEGKDVFDDLDYRGSYAVREDGTLSATFSPYDLLRGDDDPLRSDVTYSAVLSVRFDAGHEYGTESRETVGVTVVSTDCPEFLSLVGEEIAMTGANWFRGDLDGDPADAIREMTLSDGVAALYEDAAAYEFSAEQLAYGEALTALYPSSYDEDGNPGSDPEADPSPDRAAVNVADLGDLCLCAENVGRLEGRDSDRFMLTAFRWRGKWYELDRPLYFGPYWFGLSSADDFTFFTVWAPSGQNADVSYIFLTEDGAYCFDSAEAEAGYQLRVRENGDGTAACIRTNADFLDLQEISMLYAFRNREDEPYTETGSLRYEDGRFIYTLDETLTGSGWFEEQKKNYPKSYPAETFLDMSFRDYLSGYLPKTLRDEALRAKGLFTPEEAEEIAGFLVTNMMPKAALDEGYPLNDRIARNFISLTGVMARLETFPDSLRKLWHEGDDAEGWEGMPRAHAYRIASEMFGIQPDDPRELEDSFFRYDAENDRYVVNPTGLSHGYFDYEDMSVVWDEISVAVRFRLVSYVHDPADGPEPVGLAGERIDYGEYRLIFSKTNGSDAIALPHIRLVKRGEIETGDSPEPPVGEEIRNMYPVPDFLDEEQRELYLRAMTFLPAAWGPSAYYIEDFLPRGDGEPFIDCHQYPHVTIYDPETGMDLHYLICHGRYENWADFDDAGRFLFTAELWESVTGPGKRCAEYGGKTCVMDADAGSGGYTPSLDRFELLEKTDERIVYRYTTFYLARGTFEVESAERVTVTMVKTTDGWRFASFRNGNWEPVGTQEPERVLFYATDHAEFTVRELVRHVMDESWLDGKTSYSALDAVRFADTMPLWKYPYSVAPPSEDGMSVRIDKSVCADAVHNLFGIRDFDYFAAVREAFGDDAVPSAWADGDAIVWPVGMGENTTKFDISEILTDRDEDGVVQVYAHLMNASDYPWDEADYGTVLFTFAPDFDGPCLTVEKKEPPSDALSVWLRELRAEDLLTVDGPVDPVSAEELAPLLNRLGLRDPAAGTELSDLSWYYTLEVLLPEPSGTLLLFADTDGERIGVVLNGAESSRAVYRDRELSRLLREAYRVEDKIDEEAFELWGQAVRSRAEDTVRDSLGMNGGKVYTGYEICVFAAADSFEENGARYTVWNWAPAYLTDDPDNVVWAGGMFLDADGRVCGAETETYLARMEWPSGDVTLFFDWTLYHGPDEETGKLWGREKIVRGFAEMLENLPDGPVDEVTAEPEPVFEPYPYEIATALQRKEEHGDFLIDVDIKEIRTDSPHEAAINKVIRDDFMELYNGYMEQLESFYYDFFRLKIVTEFCERDGVLCVTVRAELPKTYLGPDRIANIFYNIRTDSLLTREEFAAREGIDLSSVLRELEALYPQGSDGSPFSYEIVGLRTRAAGEIGFYVDRIYRMDGEVEARETLFYRADAGTLMPSENPDTDYLVLPYFGQEQTAWDASDPFRITIFVQNAGRRSWPMDQSFYAEDESDPVGWVTFSAVWDLGAFGGDFAKMASAVLPSWQKGHTAAVGEPEFVAGSEDDALFRFRTVSIPNQVLSPEAPEEEENWCYIRRAMRSGQLRNGDPVILTFAGRNPRLPGTDEGFLEALRSKTDTSFLAGRVYVAGTVSNSARNLSELSAYSNISSIEFAEAFAEGDAEALDAMRYREDGSYSETGLPEVVFVMYEMERLCPSGCRIVMKAEFGEGNGMFSPGIHTFELLSSLDQPLIREISGGAFRLADIGRRDDAAWLEGGEFPEAERALAAFLWLEPYDAQPGYTPLGALEFFTRFFTVQSEKADGDEVVFTVRFWHDASMLVPSELREYRFRDDGAGYVLSGNLLLEETKWAPGGWMV